MQHSVLEVINATHGLSVAEATEALGMLNNGPFPEQLRQPIMTAIQGSLVHGDAPALARHEQGRLPMQKHVYLHRYFSATEWQQLRSVNVDFNSKLNLVVKRCGLLGLTCPTEITSVHMVAILYLASHQGPPETIAVSAADALGTLRDLKCTMKAARLVNHSGLTEYPKP